VELLADGQRHMLVVRAEGYQEWRIVVGAGEGRSLSGPVRLKRWPIYLKALAIV
jgi:hypothetical protein